jgi:hypothetical protein
MEYIVCFPHDGQGIVISGAIPFKEIREIERRLPEQSLADQVKRDHESSDTAVAVQKGMNRLELIMGKGYSNKMWDILYFFCQA